MAGYSSTPLARKLGLKPEHDLVLVAAPDGWQVPDLPDAVTVRDADAPGPETTADVVLLFVRSRAELARWLPVAGHSIFPAGAIWVAWPRKAGGHVSDVAENDIRDVALPVGLVDVKVAALDQDWSGLKIVWRVEHRGGSGPPVLPGADG